MKTLTTSRLILRSFVTSDLDDFYRYAKVKGVGERAGWKPHESREESKQILDSFVEADETYAVVLKESNMVIGSIGIHKPKETDDPLCREIGYVLAREHWGKGLMSEAVKAVIKHCFDTLKLTKLVCGHFLDNDASRKIIEKNGFVYTHEAMYHSEGLNTTFRSLRYELTKERYIRLKKT